MKPLEAKEIPNPKEPEEVELMVDNKFKQIQITKQVSLEETNILIEVAE